MGPFSFFEIDSLQKEDITTFFIEHWGSPQMVISSGVFRCDELDGFAAVSELNEIIGLVTYNIEKDECEIISLDSLIENKGIGTELVTRVEAEAKNIGCSKVKLVTTNDNLHALLFYQRRGYRLVDVLIDAVDKAREIKPEIPRIAENGIPIQDELLLEKNL